MNDRKRLSRTLAGLFSFVAFVGSFATLALMLIVGAALPGYAKGNLDAGYEVEAETLLGSIAAILAFGFAIIVFRAFRHQLSPAFIFHGSYIL